MNDKFIIYLKKLYHFFRSKYELKKSISGKNNIIFFQKSIVRKTYIDIVGNNNFIDARNGVTLENTFIRIRGDNHKLIIKSDTWINSGNFFFEDTGCEIFIHNGCRINKAKFSAVEDGSQIVIGAHSGISEECDLRTSDSHSIIDLETNTRINPAASIHIGEHVWLGKRVIVLKGVSIGAHSIVGLGSIVTKDIQQNCIAAGVPAKTLRKNTTWKWEKIHSKSITP